MSALLASCIFFGVLLIVQNEQHTFNWSAYLSMFGLGWLDNTIWCYLNMVLGFEFESKILPFGAKTMVEMLTVTVVAGALSIWSLDSIGSYRLYWVF